MTSPWDADGPRSTVLGRDERATDAGVAVRSRLPSLYADPLAWLICDGVGAAARDAAETSGADLTDSPDEVALVLVSAYCTDHSIRTVAEGARRGRVSPLRFAGTNPGSAGSLGAIVHGFRGPTLTLCSPAARTAPAARTVADAWLDTAAAAYVVLAVHERTGASDGGRDAVRTVVLGPAARS
jgi:hypothetical protein